MNRRIVITTEDINMYSKALWKAKYEMSTGDKLSDSNVICSMYANYKYHVCNKKWKINQLGSREGKPIMAQETAVNYESIGKRDCECMDTYVAKKFLQLKDSAKKRDKEFDLTLSTVRYMLRRKTCYYTGLPVASYEDPMHPNQLTIDRVDPSLGYVKGNVVVCSHLANQFKNKIEHDFTEHVPRDKVLKILNKMFS